MRNESEFVRPRVSITDAELIVGSITTIQIVPGLRDYFSSDELAAMEEFKQRLHKLSELAKVREFLR